MDAERAARQIVTGIAARLPEVFLTPAAQIVGLGGPWRRKLTASVLHVVQNTVCPPPTVTARRCPAASFHPTLPGSVFGALTSLGRAAAARFNELGRTLGSDGRNRASEPAA